MLNLFAFRATDPKAMKAELEPIGPDNDRQSASIATIVGAFGILRVVASATVAHSCAGCSGRGHERDVLWKIAVK